MAIKTTLQQLEEIQAAISAVSTGGQSVTFEGKQITYANLNDLHKQEAYLELKYKNEQRVGGMCITVGSPRRY